MLDLGLSTDIAELIRFPQVPCGQVFHSVASLVGTTKLICSSECRRCSASHSSRASFPKTGCGALGVSTSRRSIPLTRRVSASSTEVSTDGLGQLKAWFHALRQDRVLDQWSGQPHVPWSPERESVDRRVHRLRKVLQYLPVGPIADRGIRAGGQSFCVETQLFECGVINCAAGLRSHRETVRSGRIHPA